MQRRGELGQLNKAGLKRSYTKGQRDVARLAASGRIRPHDDSEQGSGGPPVPALGQRVRHVWVSPLANGDRINVAPSPFLDGRDLAGCVITGEGREEWPPPSCLDLVRGESEKRVALASKPIYIMK